MTCNQVNQVSQVAEVEYDTLMVYIEVEDEAFNLKFQRNED
jgi:hypothetical protein